MNPSSHPCLVAETAEGYIGSDGSVWDKAQVHAERELWLKLTTRKK